MNTLHRFNHAPHQGLATGFAAKPRAERGAPILVQKNGVCWPAASSLHGPQVAFTLLELLVVMAIMGIIVMLMIPSLKSIGGGTSLTGEGNRIASLIIQARQNAMSKNALTALVVITDPGLAANLSAASLWESTPRSDGTSPTPADWKQISKWEVLRKGVVFVPPTGTQMDPPAVVTNPPFPVLNQAGKALAADGFVCKIFLPAGGLLAGKPGLINLAEGFIAPGDTAPTYTNKKADGTPANLYTITIIAATGHLVVERP